MIRYTTPTLILRVPVKIEDADIFVTIRQENSSVSLKVASDDISYEDDRTVIRVYLTQDQTSKFRSYSHAEVQINWIYADGKREATRKKRIDIDENLLDKEIQYGR